ncbi:MAG: (2Fe-2S)-binding protein [Actinomycetota bacterium]|nr:(2Fe-2S)-binding protein [Actinomycetota bacterium]
MRRSSRCLVYRVRGGPLCPSCPRRAPAERELLLGGIAGRH